MNSERSKTLIEALTPVSGFIKMIESTNLILRQYTLLELTLQGSFLC